MILVSNLHTWSNESVLEYAKINGFGLATGGLISVVLYFVLIPYGLYRAYRWRKSKGITKE